MNDFLLRIRKMNSSIFLINGVKMHRSGKKFLKCIKLISKSLWNDKIYYLHFYHNYTYSYWIIDIRFFFFVIKLYVCVYFSKFEIWVILMINKRPPNNNITFVIQMVQYYRTLICSFIATYKTGIKFFQN